MPEPRNEIPGPAEDTATHWSANLGAQNSSVEQILRTLCRVASARCAAIISLAMSPSASTHAAVHAHPDPRQHAATGRWLVDALANCPPTDTTSPVTIAARDDNEPFGSEPTHHTVYIPVSLVDGSRCLAAFFLHAPSERSLRNAAMQLEAAAALLPLTMPFAPAAEAATPSISSVQVALRLVTAVNGCTRFRAAAMAICNQLAADCNATRVGLGLLKGRYVRLEALSHTERFARRTRLVQDIESAMEECLDQDLELLLPAADDAPVILRATHELSTRHGPHAACLIPLRLRGDAVGVISIEREPHRPFSVEEVAALRLAAELITPRLLAMQSSDRWPPAKLLDASRRVVAFAVGPQHTWAKLSAVAVVAAVIWLTAATGTYRVSAPFVIAADAPGVVSAPFDGYLQRVMVAPGDTVVAGESILALLDTTELELELAAERADLARFLKEADLASRRGETAEEEIAHAEADRVRARLALLEHRVTAATLRSPITGTVMRGDWRHRVGGRVALGEDLFEIADLTAIRAELAVPSGRIADVVEQQAGRLMTHAQPDQEIGFEVIWISPVAERMDDSSVFVVHARPSQPMPPLLRPGTEGIARIDAGERRLIWLWSRDLIDWLRMTLWW